MSGLGGGGGPGSAATYSSLRRGIKATTSKIMNATSSVKRPGNFPVMTSERSITERGDPGRFVEGVSFKGKLIGALQVSEARGDTMCQEALAELKTAIKAAGEHKQKIAINVAMDGIRLRDERTGDCLYHHPVHKISFIAQDMTDTRAFGYIFGSPDAGHKFFGIKTEKAANQVVIAMRDLFQVVFELKKKEIEKAKAQLREGGTTDFKDTSFGGLFGTNGDTGIVSASLTCGAASGAIADLLDLQSELSSLQKGLSEISKRAQAAQKQQSQSKEEHFDPFGDSFKPVSASNLPSTSASEGATKPPRSLTVPVPAPLAPPPISGRARHDSQSQKLQHQTSFNKGDFVKFPVDFKNINQSPPQNSERKEDRYAVFKDLAMGGRDEEASSDVFHQEEVHRKSVGSASSVDSYLKNDEFDTEWILVEPTVSEGNQQSGYDIFTDLDPLGPGKGRPFVDKKDFFNDIKKATARRLLRELGDGEESQPGSPRVPIGIIPADVSALVASSSLYSSAGNSSSVNSFRQPQTRTTPVHGTVLASHSESLSPQQTYFPDNYSGQSTSRERLDTPGFADFNQFADSPRSQRSDFSGSNFDEPPTSLSVASLAVALPPESFRDSPPPFSPPPPPQSPSVSISGSNSPQPLRQRHSPLQQSRLMKQMTVSAASPLSPKTLPRNHKFYRQISHDCELESHSRYLNLQQRGLSETEFPLSVSHHDGGISPRPRPRSSLSKLLSSSSATLPLRSSAHARTPDVGPLHPIHTDYQPFPKFEEAPEPPPRPAHVEPPPLPPKRMPSHITLRPPPRPPPTSDQNYSYINEYDSSPDDMKGPPIPVPHRKPRHVDSSSQPFIPDRCSKPSPHDGFQFPKARESPTRETSGAVPKTSSRASTSSKSSTPGKSPRSGLRQGISPSSVDLTNTSLDQLASTLDIPIDRLAKMTVVELAACLAQVQLRQETTRQYNDSVSSNADDQDDSFQSYAHDVDSKCRRSRKSSVDWENKFGYDEEEMFAKFDAQFPKSPLSTPTLPGFPTLSSEFTPKFPLGAPVSEDRYAVFRELSSSGKQKSVFDENFLTPQNSMEDEISEVSSGTFKANFADDFYRDSIEQKSSISDDGGDVIRNKDWDASERIDHECVTVFRSPDISEYENFEPNFDGKFEDDFSAQSLSEKSNTPVNSPAHLNQPNFNSLKKTNISQKSPFTDDFCKVSDASTYGDGRFSKISSDEKFVANFNDSAAVISDRGSSLSSEFDAMNSFTKQSDSFQKSPFKDNFSELIINKKGSDCKYDYIENGSRSRRLENGSQRTKKYRSKKRSLDAPNGSFNGKSSPFDDDFIQRTDRYEVLRDLDNECEPSLEGEISKFTKEGERLSPFEDSWQGSPRNTPYDDQKSLGSLQSIQEESRNNVFNSPFENNFNLGKESIDQESSSRRNSENRKSPYSDGFSTSGQLIRRNRVSSRLSQGSEGSSDIRHSPFEDSFTSTPKTAKKEVQEPENNAEETNNFADFETAFQKLNKEDTDSLQCTNDIDRLKEEKAFDKIDEDLGAGEDNVFPELETEFKVSARFAKPDMAKSISICEETEGIFRRESDPFADDFFSEDPDAGSSHHSAKDNNSKNENSSWQHESFDNYSFTKNV